MKANPVIHAFNRGVVSRRALARVDLDRMKLSAEVQTNFLPTTLGPMMLRPGTAYVGEVRDSEVCEVIPFQFASDQTAIVEMTPLVMRVLVDEEPVTRIAVATTITNGDFSSDAGWTLTGTGGGAADIDGGKLLLSGVNDGGVAYAERSISVAGGDTADEHGIRIVVDRGPVAFTMGTTSGDDNVVSRQELEAGTHSLAVTPGATTIYVRFESMRGPQVIVDSIAVEAAGEMELPTPYANQGDLSDLRWEQSGDVIFVGCEGYRPYEIQRRGDHSWSFVEHRVNDGPFLALPTIADTTLTPSATTGDITLTASRALFRPQHEGALFRLFSGGQQVDEDLAALDATTTAIEVTGVDNSESEDGINDRVLYIFVTDASFVGTLVVERSFSGPTSGFTTVAEVPVPAGYVYEDSYSNTKVWVRVRVSAYTSGSVNIQMVFPTGGGPGIVRITDVTNKTTASAQVLKTLSSPAATDDWLEGAWSDVQGWPSSPVLHDGRLWWFGRDLEWASVSDGFRSHDRDAVGDAGPIARSIGQGPVESIRWGLSLQRLLVGTASGVISVRSSSFDAPLTPTDFTQRLCSRQGTAAVRPVAMDTRGLYVQASKRRLMELEFIVQSGDYQSRDLSQLVPDLADSNIVSVAIQRQPDTRIHCVLQGGDVLCLVYEPDDKGGVLAWWRIEFGGSGIAERVFVQPGEVEDQVYYVVRRTIDGNTVRYIERLALMDQARGGTDNRIADSHIVYEGAAAFTLSGLDHLEGETVVVWGNGKDLGTKVVSGGQITGLSEAVTTACVGLGYDASYKSAKLAYGGGDGTALTKRKRIERVGLILCDAHHEGLRAGQDFDHLEDLPLVDDGVETPEHTVWEDYDRPSYPVNGEWTTDARLCLEASAPRPVTVMAAVVSMETNG